jgi:hypothetical protein
MMQPGIQGALSQVAPSPLVMQMNLPAHVLEYNQNGSKIYHMVNLANPHYKTQVGEFIYEHVENLAGEEFAPKITGMLIDLPISEIQGYVLDYSKL